MVNHLCKFIPQLSNISQPLRALLQKDNEFVWDQSQKLAFQEIKTKLTNAPVLALYNPHCDLRVLADSSLFGLGGLLEQFESNTWKPVAYASKSLSKTERQYAQIEKEALSIVWACEKFRQYILGKQIIIRTDHKPLINILNHKSLDELTPKLQRMRMKLMEYSFTAQHVSGKEFYVPDTLSRSPFLLNIDCDNALSCDVTEEIFVHETILKQSFPATDARLEQVKIAQNSEPETVQLKKYIFEGWPKFKTDVNPSCYAYWQNQHKLTIHNDIIMYENRILLPPSMRRDILQCIHQGHEGITKCHRRACDSVYWPGITQHIKDMVSNCPACIQNRVNHAEPLMTSELPEKPWEMVGLDLAKLNNQYLLIIIDYYSKYPEVFSLKNISSEEVISKCKAAFERHGIPRLLIFDNGKQFIGSEFKDFASKYGFTYVTRSPEYPQSNGLAESAVKIIKKLLIKSEDPNLALLSYRNTPLYDNGLSPSQLLMGRRLRDTLPVLNEKLKPISDNSNYRQWHNDNRIKQSYYYNKHHLASPLSSLHPKNRVWVTDRKEYGIVVEQTKEPRSYIVRTEDGDFRRNRKSLVPAPQSEMQSGGDPDEEREKPPDRSVTIQPAAANPDMTSPVLRRSKRTIKPVQRLNL